MKDGKLYGRGGADDGYAVFSSLTAIAALKEQNIKLARCVLLIEACEESGSVDLPAHLDALGDAIGDPSLVVCLDAECGNYDQVWCTTSLRGNLSGRLRVKVLTEGVHSGMATGIAPTPFRIVSQILARVESPVTGDLLLEELQANIPKDRRAQVTAAAQVLGDTVAGKLPWADGRATDFQRPRGAHHQQHLARHAGGDGCRRPAPGWLRRQRVTAGTHFQTLAAAATDHRPRASRQSVARNPGARSALRRAGEVRVGWRNSRLECARLRPVARGVDRAGLAGNLRSRRRRTSAAAARYRSWGCWAHASRVRSSSSPVCWDRMPTRMARTSSCTSNTRRSSPPAYR